MLGKLISDMQVFNTVQLDVGPSNMSLPRPATRSQNKHKSTVRLEIGIESRQREAF